MPQIDTPCRKICRQDKAVGYCVGCGRTVDEVFDWTFISDEARAEILAQLPARLAALERLETDTPT